MRTRLPLLMLLFLFLPVSGQAQVDSLDWNLKINGAVIPDTLTIDWLAEHIEEAPRKKPIGKHEDHQHYAYHWKKLGLQVEANQPGGFVNSIEVSFRKSKVRTRASSSATPILSLSVSGKMIDERTPISSFIREKWDYTAASGRSFVSGQNVRINAYLSSSRKSLSSIMIAFSR